MYNQENVIALEDSEGCSVLPVEKDYVLVLAFA